jgi:NAD(P)-dependent dehydrogenase (short-subunit alcohol dehydrogenase family)
MSGLTLRGSHALVTGGSKGLGASLVREFTARGARVTVLARPSQELDAIILETGAASFPLDLSDHAGLKGVIEQATEMNGPVDVLVNNAAAARLGKFSELSEADMAVQLFTNLIAPMELARQATPGMMKRGQGVIMNVASLGANVSLPGVGCYSVSKTGLVKFTVDLNGELKGSGVRAVLVSLGAVGGTPMIKQFLADPTVGGFAKRFETFTTAPEVVARRMADNIERGKKDIAVIPRVASPLVKWSLLPTRLTSRLISS